MMEAAQGISIFLEDHDSYDKAMQKYFGRVPAYVYLQSDGPYPKIAPGHSLSTRQQVERYWHGQNVFNQDGLAQETCRDFSHLGSGLSSMAHIAETARIQGWDVFKYTDIGTRLKHAYEFHTKYQMQPQNRPDWLCKGKLITDMGPGMFSFLPSLILLPFPLPNPPPPCFTLFSQLTKKKIFTIIRSH